MDFEDLPTDAPGGDCPGTGPYVQDDKRSTPFSPAHEPNAPGPGLDPAPGAFAQRVLHASA
jgi:hypothetical protein